MVTDFLNKLHISVIGDVFQIVKDQVQFSAFPYLEVFPKLAYPRKMAASKSFVNNLT